MASTPYDMLLGSTISLLGEPVGYLYITTPLQSVDPQNLNAGVPGQRVLLGADDLSANATLSKCNGVGLKVPLGPLGLINKLIRHTTCLITVWQL